MHAFSIVDHPNFRLLLFTSLSGFKVAGSKCTFTRINDDCPLKYKGKGDCNLYSLSSQLFPDVSLENSTNKFIVPTKFNVGSFEAFACSNHPRSDIVSFVAKSTESIEIAPQRMTLGAETRLEISWNFVTTFSPEKLEVKLSGFTSVGKNFVFFLEELMFRNKEVGRPTL